MEIFRFKKEKFNLENFIHYYNDNIEELLMEYPHYVSRICLIDRDYMDVIIFDEDYEYLGQDLYLNVYMLENDDVELKRLDLIE